MVGSPKTVHEGLERYAEAYGVDEFLCVTVPDDLEARQRSYMLLADAPELDALPKAAE